MAKTAGIGQLVTVLALIIALVGVVLTYNGVDDLRVVAATAFSVVWLSLAMLGYYRKLMMQRVREQQYYPSADPPE